MKKKLACAFIIFIISVILTGCWNYREVEQLAIVSGVAIDRYGKDNVLVTAEIVSVDQTQKGSSLKPVYIEATGTTFFEAIRSMVSIQGKKLYWSHAKTIIVSEQIAKEGLTREMDFFNRDAEVRKDVWVLISKEKTAREIFKSKPIFEKLTGFEIDDTMRAQEAISRYPSIELYELFDTIASKESATVLPTVSLMPVKEAFASYVGGTAIIKKDKLLGYLDETDSKSLLWVQDELKGGLYPVKNVAGTKHDVSLEIFRNKTKIKPKVIDEKLVINIDIVTDVNIGEILGNEDFISEKPRKVLENYAEAQIRKDIESLVKKAQNEYKTDFLGFGEHVKRSMPNVWRSIEKDWDDVFADAEIKVSVDIRIRGSATTRKPIKVGA